MRRHLVDLLNHVIVLEHEELVRCEYQIFHEIQLKVTVDKEYVSHDSVHTLLAFEHNAELLVTVQGLVIDITRRVKDLKAAHIKVNIAIDGCLALVPGVPVLDLGPQAGLTQELNGCILVR